MATLSGNVVFDGDKAIAKIVAERGYYQLFPLDGSGWSKGMGQSVDESYIAGMFACSVCGGCATPDSFMEPACSEMLKHHICFSCNHWRGIVENDSGAKKDSAVVVDGKHYYIGKNTEHDYHRWSGFGGDVFYIHFHDGRKVRCNNLWSQGGIPKLWREQLPDNAVFVKGPTGE